MKAREPIFEKSRSVEDLERMRLMALLRELARDKGVKEAAQALGVDHRTLVSSLESGKLTRRMRVALGKALLEGGGSPAAEQRERNDALEGRLKEVEGRVEALGKDVGRGLAAVQGEAKALRSEHAQGTRQVERRLAQLEAGGGARGAASEATSAVGEPKRRTSLRREYPELVTLEPADDDEEVFGDAWPLIVEWRGLKDTHPDRGGSLSWLVTEERFLSVELALLQEHGMTLPPETYPLKGFDRNGQLTWRQKALYDTRRARAKRELLRWVRRVLTLGLWEVAAFGVRTAFAKLYLR